MSLYYTDEKNHQVPKPGASKPPSQRTFGNLPPRNPNAGNPTIISSTGPQTVQKARKTTVGLPTTRPAKTVSNTLVNRMGTSAMPKGEAKKMGEAPSGGVASPKGKPMPGMKKGK